MHWERTEEEPKGIGNDVGQGVLLNVTHLLTFLTTKGPGVSQQINQIHLSQYYHTSTPLKQIPPNRLPLPVMHILDSSKAPYRCFNSML